MARTQGDVTVTLSVLDRLIDREPKSQIEAPLSAAQSIRLNKRGVHRDLGWLLNTRRISDEPPESLREANRSVYVYGLQDFSSYSMGSPADRAKLTRQLVTAIRLFEPRLADVQILPVESDAVGLQELRFRIEALLLMDPNPIPISFDTVIELKSSVCRLTGTSDAG
jgi:type VI secretion system protein ImpF